MTEAGMFPMSTTTTTGTMLPFTCPPRAVAGPCVEPVAAEAVARLTAPATGPEGAPAPALAPAPASAPAAARPVVVGVPAAWVPVPAAPVVPAAVAPVPAPARAPEPHPVVVTAVAAPTEPWASAAGVEWGADWALELERDDDPEADPETDREAEPRTAPEIEPGIEPWAASETYPAEGREEAYDLQGDAWDPPAPVPARAHSGIPGPGMRPWVPDPDAVAGIPVRLVFGDGSAAEAVRVPVPPRRPGSSPRRDPVPAAPRRTAPPADPRLRECRGPALPGGAGVLTGLAALAGWGVVAVRSGVLPGRAEGLLGLEPRPFGGLGAADWPALGLLGVLGVVALLAFGGLGRGRTGHAWVLTLFGRYRGTVRRTGLVWVSPLLLRRRVDVRLRHWRSEPMPAVDATGLALRVVVQVVWQVRDTARAALAVEEHTEYLAEQVEAATARVLSRLPADAFEEDGPTLRDAEAVGADLTRMLAAETEAVGIEVFSAQPTRIEYAPEVAAAMQRRRIAVIDARHRDSVLSSVVDAVHDTVGRLTSRGLVELDDYERKALVKDLTVAFCTSRQD
ncbi:SPFH domain-containing protein [Streptomyces sp. NPDC097619]|uniref:SPFH domain-containing protein n=1 Tax=Streptomyces sp. NPDC097619 TaxID=3157228 RepID=UPI00331D8686